MTLVPPKPTKPIDQLKIALELLVGQVSTNTLTLTGRENTVKTAKGTRIKTRLTLVEADNLIVSHNETGTPNPAYPQELQPRDRSRDSSIQQIQGMANNLDPESLGRTGRADNGAPIIGSDMVVESGNGRSIAIQLAYKSGKADEYKQWLIDEAEYFGFSPSQVEQFKQPVLVRVRDTDVDRKQFAVESNQDDKLSYSATEKAKTDANRISGPLLDLFNVGDNGDLLTASNQKFISGFLSALGEHEAAQYMTGDGKPTQALVTRIKAAIFSKAYNDDRLLEMMADQTKPELLNVLNALSIAAPKFIEAQSVSKSIQGKIEDIASQLVDGIEASFDQKIISAIIDATNVINRAKQNNQDINEYVSQQGLFDELGEGVGELAIFIASNTRSAKKLSIAFKAMAEFAENSNLDSQNFALFGDPEPVKLVDALEYANSKLELEYGDNATISLFDSAISVFDDIGTWTRPAIQSVPAQPLEKLKTCLYLYALKNELVEHTTKRGKLLQGIVITGLKINDAKQYDNYPFFKNGGVFLRLSTIASIPDNLLNPDQQLIKEVIGNVSNPSGSMEPVGTLRTEPSSPADTGHGSGADESVAGESVTGTGATGDQQLSDSGLSENDGAGIGSGSDHPDDSGTKRSFTDSGTTTDDSSGSSQFDGTGSRTKQRRNRAIIQDAKSTRSSLDAKAEQQAIANKHALDGTQPHEWGDIENIHESLPYLMLEQRDDVLKAEKRLIEENANGILFTNGTGTGKTFTGLGTVRRFMNAGKTNILIVTLNDKIVKDFVKSGKSMGIDIHQLTGINDNGDGVSNIVTTTYANFGQNDLLGKKDWDLIIVDEAHTLSQNANGDKTASLEKLRALTGHHSGFYEWARMRYSEQYPEKDDLGQQDEEALKEWYKLIEPKKQEWKDNWTKQAGSRAKVVFLSATPFSYVKTIDWAEGYLFDFETPSNLYGADSQSEGLIYNSGSQREKFYMQNFGYRMRYNKLTQPDGKVDGGVMERMFAEKLKETGALTGRDLQLNFDYDRKFVLIESKAGEQIDEGLSYISDTKDKDDQQQYSTLSYLIHKRFDYLSRRKLLEAIKAEACIEQVKKHLALGRKVVIFHDYNEGGGFAPFMFTGLDFAKLDDSEQAARAEYEVLERERPDLVDLSFDYEAPINTLRHAFPKAVLFNGRVSKGQRQQNIDLFNQDNSGVNVMVVQSDAGSTGISMHDTTGTHQRVIINIGQPTKPAKLRQTEGRIFRVGQASNAIHRYLTTGTAWERAAFADTIAGRAETVDNLAKGDDALVSIKEALIRAYEEAEYFEPSALDGVGGKAYDEEYARVAKLSPFDKALTYYYAKGKRSESRNSREGKEWYATPEPLGLKMVEWAGVHKGDSVLEPSAGDGAIGRFVPADADLTMIEPTESLASRAKMANTGANVINNTFESLDRVNKYHAIVMNPPFGNAGSMAIDHIRKAFNHLYDGGRIVALIPLGAMDKKVDDFIESTKSAFLAASFTLPQSTFKNAGTGVVTRIIIIERHENTKNAPDYARQLDFSQATSPEELFDRIRDVSFTPRRPRIDESLERYGLFMRTERSKFVLNGDGLSDPVIKGIVTNYWDAETNEYGEIVMRYNRAEDIIKQIQEYEQSQRTQVYDSISSSHSIPVVDIEPGTLEGFPKFDKVKDLKTYLFNTLATLPPIINRTSKHPIKFYKSGLTSSLKIKTELTHKFYEALPLLLKEAQLVDFEEVKEGKDKPHVLGYEIYKATAKLDSGKTHLVTIKVEVVKENLRMRSYYFHSVQ